jgi:hypothetical protein
MQLDRPLNSMIAPSLGIEHPLRLIFNTAMKKKRVPVKTSSDQTPYWGAEYFGLDQVSSFIALDRGRQEQVLHGCSHLILEEAQYGEKSGLSYTARMSSLSESLEEKLIYATMAAEEASHFHSLSSFLSSPIQESQDNPFLRFLLHVIDQGSRFTMIFFIQVILEGWAISHYSQLLSSCRNEELKAVLRSILDDEAKHHGSGIVISKERAPSAEELEELSRLTPEFLRMLRMGPFWVIRVLEKVAGPFTFEQRLRALQEIRTEDKAQALLTLIRKLMLQSHPALVPWVQALEQQGHFTPFSCEEVAAL